MFLPIEVKGCHKRYAFVSTWYGKCWYINSVNTS
nr:MAG TPA: ubiquitin conjugating enzyme [Caudoviricetes sp.]